MKLKEMSKEEKSLLLFLETRAVDYGGRVNTVHMNEDDMKIAEKWNKEGLIIFGRIVFRNINSDGTYAVKLSDKAWKLAHKERINRFKGMWDKRDWLTTQESKEINGDPHFSGMNKSVLEQQGESK